MTYDYHDSRRQIGFMRDLAKLKPDLDYNLLSKYGLIQKAVAGIPRRELKSSIRQYSLPEDSQDGVSKPIEYIVDAPLLGPPAFGDQPAPPPRYVNIRHIEQLGAVDFKMPIEPLDGFDYVSDAEAHKFLINRVRGWLDSFSFELQIIVAAGMRGIEKGWRTFPEPQKGSCELSSLPQAIVSLAKKCPVYEPKLHVAEWQTLKQMKTHKVDYAHAKRASNFIEALENLHRYLQPRYSREPVHYGIDPAVVKLPKTALGSEKDEEVEQYTLFISQERASELRESKAWIDYQDLLQRALTTDRLTKLYGRYGFSDDYVGMHDNIVVVASPITPIFERGKHKFSRSLLFGNQAMVTAYAESNDDMNEDLRTPFKCSFVPIDGGKRLGVEVSIRLGVKKMVHRLTPDSFADCGVAAFDMCEDRPDL